MSRIRTSGYLVKTDKGELAIARHREQEPKFKAINKMYIRYLDNNFRPQIVDGKERTGLIDINKLTVVGMSD